ncbi:hypothetical protein [Microcoleus sp. herbarium5]|uniref:hypothetical protein n=1 Tax=Microcoleus sp. herbarium5 TaxID=3055434 RepID=UPI002FD3396F
MDEAARAIESQLSDEFSIAKATYKGSGKKFFQELAKQFDIPITCPKLNADGEEIGEKPMTLDELKEEIALNIPADALLILPEAKRLTSLITFWLEDLNCRMCCFAVAKPSRDIFLKMIEIELALPDDRHIREIMQREAENCGLNISEARFSQLQSYAGRNAAAARKIVKQEKLGLTKDPNHNQYLDISPLIMGMFCCLGIIRFIGLGSGNRSLYMIGGIAMMLGLALKYLGRVSGPRRRIGQ